MTGKQRVATAVFSQYHHEMVLNHFALFELSPAIVCTLCLSWQFACFITYNLAVAARSMLQQFHGCNVCMHEYRCKCFVCAYMLHAQIIYGLISVSCTLRPNDVISVWWYHICDKWTPLDYEQRGACTWARLSRAHMWAWLSGAHMWAWLSGARSCSLN